MLRAAAAQRCPLSCAVLCREEAQNLQNAKPKLDAMGVKLVGIVKEWDEAEIKVTPLPLPTCCVNRSATCDWA